MIKENLIKVHKNIEASFKKAKRGRDEVKLIAVSKTKPISMLLEVYKQGERDFGENKVQELCEKYPEMPKDIRWHMIGHLQSNKVKYIADKVYMIHSLDSNKLAEEINKQALKVGRIIPVLVEVNIGEEDSKYGIAKEKCIDFIRSISNLPAIEVRGLMTVAPITKNPEENRVYFKQMRELSVDIMKENIDNIRMDVLSMGMTGDYEVAIEEGASYVRVGTGIFGERDYADG